MPEEGANHAAEGELADAGDSRLAHLCQVLAHVREFLAEGVAVREREDYSGFQAGAATSNSGVGGGS